MLNVRKGGHRDLTRFYPVMEMDFDKKELLPKVVIHKALLNGSQELLIFFDDESNIELGYALVCCRSLYGYVLLKYFGILPWYRDKGIGVEAMRLINKRYADRQGILAELTVFDDSDGEYLKKLRRFFARFGYVGVESDYRLGGAEVELMVKPIKGTEDISAVAHRMIRDVYSRCLSAVAMNRMIDIRPVKK